ncbi:hypothetical protein CVD25_11475 [Bacillus canaveralius]|uniref:YkoP-like domain-containing protein n=1 Tax=Bacillus canaveralius TaxID=1403243 RepID=A0A2N5GK48_9BACI|nr:MULTISPECIES: hypothetical protein [Bacillus]PLR81780.1 hypothetical protein CU635_14195 [Bacillus canaveralius]PLR86215.1 hypothetical protein CVD23_07245 [Bacillus sp. V33-4]PLR96726.1 hypothetical protein CVD25_11475 [Bacillus canaveralius]RSK49197.1 hypothetical protein EJA13_15795 [Bacillus canaveralius]
MRLRHYFLLAWSIIDPVYFFLSRLNYLDRTEEKAAIFRVRLTRYKGREVVLADGTKIKKNDVLIKIHLYNVRLLKELQHIENDVKKAVILYKKVKESLPYLALYVHQHKNNREIKGIIGITMINKGCERLGFEPHAISSRPYKWIKQLALYPIYLLSKSEIPRGSKRPDPLYLFISKDSLLKKYRIHNHLMEESPLIETKKVMTGVQQCQTKMVKP